MPSHPICLSSPLRNERQEVMSVNGRAETMNTLDWVKARGRIISVAFFVGLAVGGGAVEGYHLVHDKTTAEVFSRRLRCEEIASQYVKKESSDTELLRVELVGYSAASNSCVAYLTDWNQLFPTHTDREWRVMDLLSGEVFYSESCRQEQGYTGVWCGDGNNMRFDRRGEAAFRQALNGQAIDVDKIN